MPAKEMFKEEANGNFRTKKSNNRNLKAKWMCSDSTAEQERIIMNWKIEHSKLAVLKNREEIDWGEKKRTEY